MSKEIFMVERMNYLQENKGFTITQAYYQAKKDWQAHQGNSSISNYENHDDREDEDRNG